MTRRAELPPELGKFFAVRAAREQGVSRDRLLASDLAIEFRGARAVVPPPWMVADDSFTAAHDDLVRLCSSYAPLAPESWSFSHITAARLYRMPLPRRLRLHTELDVAVPTAAQPPRRAGVIGHRVSASQSRKVGQLPVVAPELAWLQAAQFLTVDELVVAGDFLVRRKRPLSSLDALASLLSTARRVRGVRQATAALRDVRSGTDSPPESWMRLALVRAGLPEPVVRHTVFDADGYFIGTPDLAYPLERIAVEYESEDHRNDREIYEDDIDRRELFRWAGWLVILVTARRLYRPDRVAAEVAGALRERAASR